MKKEILVLGIFVCLIGSVLFVPNVVADSTATIYIKIHRILEIEDIDPWDAADWYYHVGVRENGDWTWKSSSVNDEEDEWFVDVTHTFDVSSPDVFIGITLCDRDTIGSHDLADISSKSGDGIDDYGAPISADYISGISYGETYSLVTDSLQGETTQTEGEYIKTSGAFDSGSGTNDASLWFKIWDNYDAPVAEAGPNHNIEVGDKVNFDGGQSTVSEGSSITEYKWDVDGDLIWDYQTQTQIASYTYNTKGTYTVTLQITDSLGQIDTDTCTIYVASPPPTAAFVYSPDDYPHPTTLDTIQFTDTSTDSDGTLTSWYWEFGDGTTSTERNPTHKYESGGTKYVSLTVTDNDGETGKETKSIVVIELANIEGTVKDANGNPISGASVKLYDAGTTTVLETATTNTNGVYTMSEIETDTYDIEVTKSGYDNNKKTNKVIYAGENTVDFVLTKTPSPNPPGFELVFAFLAIVVVSMILLKRRK